MSGSDLRVRNTSAMTLSFLAAMGLVLLDRRQQGAARAR